MFKEVLLNLYNSLSFHVADGRHGWKEEAPYDAIHVGAAATEIPKDLIEQLKPGSRMVVPVGHFFQDMQVVDNKLDGSVSSRDVMSVRYVPLTSRPAQLQGSFSDSFISLKLCGDWVLCQGIWMDSSPYCHRGDQNENILGVVQRCLKRWGKAFLTREFFHAIGEKLGDKVMLITAEQDDQLVAGALNLIATLCSAAFGAACPTRTSPICIRTLLLPGTTFLGKIMRKEGGFFIIVYFLLPVLYLMLGNILWYVKKQGKCFF